MPDSDSVKVIMDLVERLTTLEDRVATVKEVLRRCEIPFLPGTVVRFRASHPHAPFYAASGDDDLTRLNPRPEGDMVVLDVVLKDDERFNICKVRDVNDDRIGWVLARALEEVR